tara:strand:- start:54906 stop:55706 length:801 start_codon:yes stop_codon:yes gene_type:complete
MQLFKQADTSIELHAKRNYLNRGGLTAAVVACCLAVSACDTRQSGEAGDAGSPAQAASQESGSNSASEPAAQDSSVPGDINGSDRDRTVLGDSPAAEMAQFSLVEQASSVLQPTENSNVSGEVTFRPDTAGEKMLIQVKLRGLSPGKHGFHIHAVGDCSAKDASSAGGHFNPYNVQHGGPDAARHHLGDLGNVTADADGIVDTTLTSARLGFSGPTSILQKAVVVHAEADDLETDPSGAAGARLACGVITQDKQVLSDSLIEEDSN